MGTSDYSMILCSRSPSFGMGPNRLLGPVWDLGDPLKRYNNGSPNSESGTQLDAPDHVFIDFFNGSAKSQPGPSPDRNLDAR
jgi:hypothetical protein